MSDARRFQLDELTIRPGTYFNPQTEVLVIVDDSPEVDHEIFEAEEFESTDWVLIAELWIAFASGRALAASRPAPGARAAAGPSVAAALQGLRRSGAITPSAYQQYAGIYNAAQRSLKRLGGTRRRELGAVLANVQAIAAPGGFIPTRLPALFLTLERNRQWWTTEPLLSGSVRVSFPGSKLV